MLALKEGGRTTGVAYRLPDDEIENELSLLWKREMITGCYLPTWCKLTLDDGRTVNALVFIMDLRSISSHWSRSYKNWGCRMTA